MHTLKRMIAAENPWRLRGPEADAIRAAVLLIEAVSIDDKLPSEQRQTFFISGNVDRVVLETLGFDLPKLDREQDYA